MKKMTFPIILAAMLLLLSIMLFFSFHISFAPSSHSLSLLYSPEAVTQQYYQWYLTCLKKHVHDLHNANALNKDCPIHASSGLADTFVQENVLTYTDQVLCDEGIPLTITIGKAYRGKDKTASVNITTIFPDHQATIPVRLRKESNIWRIFRIDCDLDGHID